jgi:hypothetical protein
MFHSAPEDDHSQVVEMIPAKVARAEHPTGAIAKAWAEEHSQQLTWAGLTTWLRGRSPD